MKKIFITGITGQDGSYLAEQCLADGEEVHGLIRRSSSFNTARIDPFFSHPNLRIYHGDLTDAGSLSALVAKIRPDDVYNLGAQSHVRISFDMPGHTIDSIVSGTLNLLEAIRAHCPEARFYQASSSEMFGAVVETPQKETTPFHPQSPYACAKVCAHQLVKLYRDSYKLHASCGILFNHESPRRGETFVTRKITRGIAKIVAGKEKFLTLGNLDAKRDWGLASEYTQAMRLMLRQRHPDDYVIATGETHSVREFLEAAFDLVGLNWKDHVKFDPRLLRPAEVDLLLGDSSKAAMHLGWQAKTMFTQLVKTMLEHDLEKEGALCK